MSTENSQYEDLLRQGALLMEEGAFTAALEQFEQLTQSQPQQPAAHYFKGLALGNLEQHEAASQAFKTALDLAPASLPILFNFAVSCLHTQRWQAAMLTLTRYINYHPRGDEFRAFLLLGVASAEASNLGEPLTFPHFLDYEKQSQHGEKYSINLQDAIPCALLVLCFTTLGLPDESAQQLDKLRTLDATLAERVETVLPDVAAWAAQYTRENESAEESDAETVTEVAATTEEIVEPKPSADFDWEAENDSLREHLARFTHLSDNGEEASPEAIEELLLTLGDAYLLVPTEGEIDKEGDSPTFSIMIRPHDAFNGDLVGIAFTGVLEARAFFGGDHTLHRVVMPGNALAGMVAELNTILAENQQVITAMIINPAGPHPYILHRADLMKIV